MARQLIRFNYFKPKLATDGEEDILWDMKPFIEFILAKPKAFSGAVVLGDEISDLEWNSCGFDESSNLYYIQLSKLRSKNIPSRKKINQDKESLQLSDDEFLGEFNLLIFDPETNVLITQGNFYGLTTKQISMSLSNLRLRFKDEIEESEEENPSVIFLQPIIDKHAIARVKTNDIYRKVTIKGADYHELANEELSSSTLSSAISALDQVNGVNFEITISMSRASKEESLSQEEVRNMVDDIIDLKEKSLDVSMNLTSRKNEENAIEYVDLLTPRLTSSIAVEVKNRSTIAAEYIFQNFKSQNYFDPQINMRGAVRSILYQS